MEKNVVKIKIFFLALNTPRPLMSVHKKNQPIRSSRLPGYRQDIYMNVLFYYTDFVRLSICLYPLNVTTAEPNGPKCFVANHTASGNVDLKNVARYLLY